MSSQEKKRLLVILPRIPWPLEKGDKLRAYHQLRILSREYEVHLFALNEGPVHPDAFQHLSQMVKSLHFFPLSMASRIINVGFAWLRGWPLQVGYFYNLFANRKLKQMAALQQPDIVYAQLARTAPYAMGIDAFRTLDLQDAFAAGIQRRTAKAAWYLRPFMRMEFRRMQGYEVKLLERFDQLTIISEADRKLIDSPEKERIGIVPNGVDTDFFQPLQKARTAEVVFTGNMAYPPNIDAARFLVQEIMPLVWETKPETRVVIAGAFPHAEVRALAGSRVKVTGWVDDIREAYASARLFIAPMRIGTGMQNKLLEAMAMEIPCITTPLANQPIGTTPGKEVRVAETPGDLAMHILELLDDPEGASAMAKAAATFVREKYSWEGATAHLVSLFQDH